MTGLLSLFIVDAVTQLLVRAFNTAPRGTSARIARELEVSPQTVSKWKNGDIIPEQFRWSALEELLKLKPGEISRTRNGAVHHLTQRRGDVALGIPVEVQVALTALGAELQMLRDEVAELRDEIHGPVQSSDPALPARRPTMDRLKS